MRPRWTRTTRLPPGGLTSTCRRSAEDPARARADAALGRLPAGLQPPGGWLLDRWPGRILLQAAAGLGRIEVFDRSMTIAAQFFTSVLPVLILIATLGSNSDRFADAIDMPEESRQVLEGAVDDGGAAFGIVGAIFVLVSATSLSRALARAFTAIWGLPRPPTSLRSAWRWLAVVLVFALSLVIVRAASEPLDVLPPRELWPRVVSLRLGRRRSQRSSPGPCSRAPYAHGSWFPVRCSSLC